MLKLKLQYFGHLMRRADSLGKTLMLGKIEGRRRRDDRGWDVWMASPTQCTWVWASSRSWWWTGKHGMLQSMGSQRVKHQTRLSDWSEPNHALVISERNPLSSLEIHVTVFEALLYIHHHQVQDLAKSNTWQILGESQSAQRSLQSSSGCAL